MVHTGAGGYLRSDVPRGERRERERETETDREREKERERERKRQIETNRDKERERQRETERDTERERNDVTTGTKRQMGSSVYNMYSRASRRETLPVCTRIVYEYCVTLKYANPSILTCVLLHTLLFDHR